MRPGEISQKTRINQFLQFQKSCINMENVVSTFYGLCARTGPYYRYIVMTTADYVRRVGHKTLKILLLVGKG